MTVKLKTSEILTGQEFWQTFSRPLNVSQWSRKPKNVQKFRISLFWHVVGLKDVKFTKHFATFKKLHTYLRFCLADNQIPAQNVFCSFPPDCAGQNHCSRS